MNISYLPATITAERDPEHHLYPDDDEFIFSVSAEHENHDEAVQDFLESFWYDYWADLLTDEEKQKGYAEINGTFCVYELHTMDGTEYDIEFERNE